MQAAKLGAFFFALVATPVAAQPAPPEGRLFISPMGQPFHAEDGLQAWLTAADTDHNGSLSLPEFQADARAFFAHADANQDQGITSVEFTALLQHEAPEALSRYSLGPPIDPTVAAPGEEHHRRHRPNVGPMLTEDADTPSRPVHPHRALTGAARFGILDIPEPVMSCDTDFSGRVTQAEFDACAAQRFSEIDADHDGLITLDEARAKRATLIATH